MKSTLAVLAFVASALASPMPQGVTSAITPSASAPAGCSTSRSDSFQITVVNATTSSKRDVEKRQQAGVLTLTLTGGKLTDQAGRTGYIASNYQFQFDSPPQTGAIYTSGFSVCGNNSLALGGSAVFYQCWSGGFYNLYDRHWANQCSPIYLVAIGGSGGGATQISDGQPQGPPVTQISDGQPQGPKPPPVTQISDGQPQAPTGPAVTQISDGQPQAPTGPAVTQISDGQPQVPSGAPKPPPVTQISDGQPQAPKPTGPPVTQISDGQPQVPKPTGPRVTQISDGQPQAPKPTGPPVTQISDGQPQAPSVPPAPPVSGPAVTQISYSKPQAPKPTGGASTPPAGNATFTTSAPPAQFTGAAASPVYGAGAMVAGLLGLFAML